MNIFGKTLIFVFLAAGMLASCSSVQSTPTMSQADKLETAIATVSTAFAETPRVMPTNTPMALPTFSLRTITPLPPLQPTPTPLVFTDPSIPLSERIVYYRVVTSGENPIPEGTVLAVHLFAPTYSDETYSSDTAADLRTALEAVLQGWTSTLEIVDVTFGIAHADVVLQGDYHVAGDAQLVAASWQILLTVFANPSVQTAAVTLNGGTIWNWGVAHPSGARPDDYVFTRAEIETYMKEHAYVSPGDDIDPSSPYGERTVTIGQVLVFPDFSLIVLPIDVRDAQKFANFRFVGTGANTGIVGEGETQFKALNQLGGTSADHFAAGDGLIVGVSSITDQGIVARFDRYQAREVALTGTPSADYFLSVGDILRLPFGTLQLVQVTNFHTGEALFWADGAQVGNLIHLKQGYRVDLPHLSATEIGPIQILPGGISFKVDLLMSERIVYYYFMKGGFTFVPQGSVLTPRLLVPSFADEKQTSDTAADLRTGLELALQHEWNAWTSSDLEIVDVAFGDGHADIVLEGEYSGESDEVLRAAGMQILLTVFANPSVQTATVTLNGDTIGNLGDSSSTNAKPADYVYTRAEMEKYMREHAYVSP